MARVFLSSTFTEMLRYREAAKQAIEACGHVCVGMENFPAEDAAVEMFCHDEVRKCDALILVLGVLYGSTTGEKGAGMSYTEREFDAASEDPPKIRMVFTPEIGAQTNVGQVSQKLVADGYDLNSQITNQQKFRKKATQGRLCQSFLNPEGRELVVNGNIYGHQTTIGTE